MIAGISINLNHTEPLFQTSVSLEPLGTPDALPAKTVALLNLPRLAGIPDRQAAFEVAAAGISAGRKSVQMSCRIDFLAGPDSYRTANPVVPIAVAASRCSDRTGCFVAPACRQASLEDIEGCR